MHYCESMVEKLPKPLFGRLIVITKLSKLSINNNVEHSCGRKCYTEFFKRIWCSGLQYRKSNTVWQASTKRGKKHLTKKSGLLPSFFFIVINLVYKEKCLSFKSQKLDLLYNKTCSNLWLSDWYLIFWNRTRKSYQVGEE